MVAKRYGLFGPYVAFMWQAASTNILDRAANGFELGTPDLTLYMCVLSIDTAYIIFVDSISIEILFKTTKLCLHFLCVRSQLLKYG